MDCEIKFYTVLKTMLVKKRVLRNKIYPYVSTLRVVIIPVQFS